MPEASGNRNGPEPCSIDLRGTTAPPLVEVRRWASRTLTRISEAHLLDALIVTTELVTNAYDHGRGPVEVRLSHTATPCRVRIEVDDRSRTHPIVKVPALDVPGGRGMQIVNRIAADWGVQDHPATGGKTVWAVVACDGVDAVPCAAVPD
ncbi:ATP-binding protein [Amycolatopsis tolypomycina]|uniref:ATP-binding protein n=1 Tax=Amycolatopsis tolypomycina TaxID=208445 RepID=UPI0033A94E91